MQPRGRRQELETQWVEGELLVYDLRSHCAHSLPPLTGRVWELADGTKDVATLMQVLSERHEIQASSEAVRAALEALAATDLMDGASVSARGVSRADFIRNAAAVGSIGLMGAATIKSIIAPTPAAAQSDLGQST
ncbi:MAG: hypothetical protein ABL963_13090 [Longimicrobiales bacterium]